MKSKRHKNIRTTFQNFYLGFQFEQPIQILIDGNFLKAANDIQFDLQKISQILQKQISIQYTQCLEKELKDIGLPVQYLLQSLQSYKLQKCDHEQCAVKDCFIKTVGFKNKNLYSVATQDEQLIQWLQQNSIGVPIFTFVNKNIFTLKDMNAKSNQKLKKMSQKQNFVSKQEKDKIFQTKNQLKKEEHMKRKKQIQKQRQKLGIKIKKKAKGQNPLSHKRKNN